jgi:hypothetical protein
MALGHCSLVTLPAEHIKPVHLYSIVDIPGQDGDVSCSLADLAFPRLE